MKKIPTLYVRDPASRKHVLPEVTEGCEWVLDGEGVATRKFDGTCVLVRDGAMYGRREVKPGKATPADFEEVDFDETTGKRVGWVPVTRDPEWARHWEAWRLGPAGLGAVDWPDRTYELCGPKVNNNPEQLDRHVLIPHGWVVILDAPRSFDLLCDYLTSRNYEGIVWHHPDGRRAKLKKRDFA